ncbi:hypothetical protein V6Z12_D04G085400 [Gossypium hirsutum]
MTTGVVFCFLQNFQGACGTVTVDGYIKVRYISMQTQLYTKGYHAQNDVEVSIKDKNDWEDVASEFQRRKSVGLSGGSDFRT